MAITYGKKKFNQHYVLYTIVTTILLCVVFLMMVGYLYNKTQTEEYENLHVQTKQIKDDIVLQLTSDRENLATMASFAAKLYRDGEGYDLMFESFNPIGMIENIGILNQDNTFSTKSGTVSMDGILSFTEEKEKGVYISGRVKDITNTDYELIRSAVPIEVDGNIVGILYGAIKPEKLGERYNSIVEELNGQLFVYEKETGEILIDTIQDTLGNISFLKDRQYNDDSSYEQLVTTDKGFVSFLSAYKNENMHLHYSTIEEFDWMIAFGRYDSQVFVGTHIRANVFMLVFFVMMLIITSYILLLMTSERKLRAVSERASIVRKELLETAGEKNNIQNALTEVCKFAKSRSAIFFDTDGEFYHYIAPEFKEIMLLEEDRKYFQTELFRYAVKFYSMNGQAVNILCIKPNRHMEQTNPDFYKFLNEHKIFEVSLSATINQSNHIAVLATINSKYGNRTRMLAQKTSACFSMALYNRNHLQKTLLSATTDSLTGAKNRVAYNNDVKGFDEQQPGDFSCIYVDVNELHRINNQYGHATGDEMLVYISNTLKEVFYGHKIYRMGGDEFLVFCQSVQMEVLKQKIDSLHQQLKQKNYHVAVGMSYRTKNTNTEEMVREAELRMYEEKAKYYQNKEQQTDMLTKETEYVQLMTGIDEIDTMISILKENYNGIYRVSMDTDKAKRILMPAYLNYNENEEHFSELFSNYVSQMVSPDDHRAMLSFMNYDAIKQQILRGNVPQISYKKLSGETVTLSVYKLGESDQETCDALWVFAKKVI